MTKKNIISKIKKIIGDFGSFEINEVEYEEPILLKTVNKDHEILIEKFDSTGIEVTEYIHGIDVDSYNIDFEDLKTDILESILRVCENYEVDCLKTEKRISN